MQKRTEAVVFAADGLARARVAWNTDDADRAAGDADKDVEILNDNAKQAQDLGNGGVAGFSSAIAALDGTRLARGRGSRGRSTASGDSDGGSSESKSGEELELHDEDEVCEAC